MTKKKILCLVVYLVDRKARIGIINNTFIKVWEWETPRLMVTTWPLKEWPWGHGEEHEVPFMSHTRSSLAGLLSYLVNCMSCWHNLTPRTQHMLSLLNIYSMKETIEAHLPILNGSHRLSKRKDEKSSSWERLSADSLEWDQGPNPKDSIWKRCHPCYLSHLGTPVLTLLHLTLPSYPTAAPFLSIQLTPECPELFWVLTSYGGELSGL